MLGGNVNTYTYLYMIFIYIGNVNTYTYLYIIFIYIDRYIKIPTSNRKVNCHETKQPSRNT